MSAEDLRKAIRISSDKFDDELEGLKNACLKELSSAGVQDPSEDDPLVKQAIVLYCKAYFGFLDDSEKYAKRFEALKITMANDATDYGGE